MALRRRVAVAVILTIIIVLRAGLRTDASLVQSSNTAVVAPHAASETTAETRRETFNIVWRTVKEKHFDPKFGGVDWDKVREDYLPRLAAVKTDAELYALLQQMLGELHESHFAIIPPDAAAAHESKEATGEIGIDVRPIGGQMVISRVKEGSTAASAGLKSGFILDQIGDSPVSSIVDRIAKTKQSNSLKPLYEVRALLSRVDGDPGTSVKLGYLDGENVRHEATIERTAIKGEYSSAIGNFPPELMDFEAKRLRGGVGYIRFNVFVPPLMERIVEAIRSMSDAPGIIFDLRGNPGGFGAMAPGIAGRLETKETSLGRMQMRVGYQNFAVAPQKNPYNGPVVVLVDQLSASTSEVMAGGLQSIGRATVVGVSTAGAALPSLFQKLPTGALFQYAIADFRTPDGALIEGKGVIPNVEAGLDRAALLNGKDSQLDAAIDQILKVAGRGKKAA